MTIPMKQKLLVLENSMISDDIYNMWLLAPEIAKHAKPGQFVSLYCQDGSRILPRPISICEIDSVEGRLRLVYRAVSKGTLEFSQMQSGTYIEVMGPLGNGFSFAGKKAILIGGGIGIPPMLQLAKELNTDISIVLGYRDQVFLNQDFEPYGKVHIGTEDGSHGVKGNVLDVIRENHLEGDIIYACGPSPMLKGIKEYALEHGIQAQLSLEERMACGIGACLACVCKSKELDSHTHVKNKRICKEGPVFDMNEVEL